MEGWQALQEVHTAEWLNTAKHHFIPAAGRVNCDPLPNYDHRRVNCEAPSKSGR